MSTTQALTIVVGYDGADAARRALARVRDLGDRAGHVLVVAVTPDVRSAGTGSQLAGATFDGSLLTREAVDLLGAQPDRRVEARTPSGDPAAVLVEVAREAGADLVVVGRRGGDFVTRTLLGSVAERVVSQAPCDVLVVA